jgi:hypothetical protein
MCPTVTQVEPLGPLGNLIVPSVLNSIVRVRGTSAGGVPQGETQSLAPWLSVTKPEADLMFMVLTFPGKVRGRRCTGVGSRSPASCLSQLDQVVIGTLVLLGPLEGEHHPPVGELVSRAGVSETEVGDEPVGRGRHPPALQEAEKDDHADGHQDAHYGDGRIGTRMQRVPKPSSAFS